MKRETHNITNARPPKRTHNAHTSGATHKHDISQVETCWCGCWSVCYECIALVTVASASGLLTTKRGNYGNAVRPRLVQRQKDTPGSSGPDYRCTLYTCIVEFKACSKLLSRRLCLEDKLRVSPSQHCNRQTEKEEPWATASMEVPKRCGQGNLIGWNHRNNDYVNCNYALTLIA